MLCQSLRCATRSSGETLPQLQRVWKQFSMTADERLGRLTMALRFHTAADKVTDLNTRIYICIMYICIYIVYESPLPAGSTCRMYIFNRVHHDEYILAQFFKSNPVGFRITDWIKSLKWVTQRRSKLRSDHVIQSYI